MRSPLFSIANDKNQSDRLPPYVTTPGFPKCSRKLGQISSFKIASGQVS